MTHHDHGHTHEHGHDGHTHPHGYPLGEDYAGPVAGVSVRGMLDEVSLEQILDREDTERAHRRSEVADLDDDTLAETIDDAWNARQAATEKIVAATEVLLVRAVRTHLPTATQIVLVEDTSHDAPHGHLGHVTDAAGTVLVDGRSDAWHDTDWAGEVDEYVFDLYHLAHEAFRDAGTGRAYVIPVA